MLQRRAAEPDPPVAGPLHLLSQQLVIDVGPPLGEELLGVARPEPPLHLEPFPVLIGFQHQQRRVRRDDVVLFGKGNDLVLNRLGRPLLEQAFQMHPGPEPGNERIALFGVFERDGSGETNRLVALGAGDDDLPHLVAAFGQIAAQQDLLRAGRKVGKRLGIDPRRAQAAELDFQVADRRPGDPAEKLQGDRLGAVLAGDPPHRSPPQRGDRAHHHRLEAAADRHRVTRGLLALIQEL